MPAWLQQVFDWLESPQPSVPPRAAALSPTLAPTSPPTVQPVPRSRRITPATSVAAPEGQGIFHHPEANREVLLEGRCVGYHLQRARRRSIGFTVGADGLAVRAPSWVTLAAVDAALQEKAAWIVRKLGEAAERQQRLETGRIQWADGAQLPYLGHALTVRLDPSQYLSGRGGALVESGPQEATLYVGLALAASPAQIRDAVQAWLMRDARQRFTERLDRYAPQLGVQWTSLRLSSAQTRWGSARADGSIRLNWRLLHYPLAVIDYVVVHELSHLRVMDHSPRFWQTVASVMPDYARLRNQLRDEPAPLWE